MIYSLYFAFDYDGLIVLGIFGVMFWVLLLRWACLLVDLVSCFMLALVGLLGLCYLFWHELGLVCLCLVGFTVCL